MGELAAWGRSTLTAFERAQFRLLLSGTPFRSDNTPIPWVEYDGDGVSSADYAYGYTDALIDGVCRPVTFHTYDGDMEWMSDGRRRRADFSVALPAAEAARRLRTALDPDGDWIEHVLRDAHAELAALRAGAHPDAGGLVVAIDKEHAERLAQRLARVAGEKPEIVTSDAADASQRIQRFAAGAGSWLVSVLMVSEGVDIPRLRVGVYATSARTELFFRQVVGRFIRRTLGPKEQMSHLFLPSDPTLKRLATQIEEERNHALIQLADGEAVERGERADSEDAFRALWSSARRDDDVLQTTQPGDALQLFADAAPAPSAALQAFTTTEPETAHERRERLRDERRALVSAIARRTGEEHRAINARVNREIGVASVAACTVEQLERANAVLERLASRG
jgi:superfamily II DNA or RNA helicase